LTHDKKLRNSEKKCTCAEQKEQGCTGCTPSFLFIVYNEIYELENMSCARHKALFENTEETFDCAQFFPYSIVPQQQPLI
jgi:hypothetical protein